jgi:hypothetical protein
MQYGIKKSGFKSCARKSQGQTLKPRGVGVICQKPQKEDAQLHAWGVSTGVMHGGCGMTTFQSEF